MGDAFEMKPPGFNTYWRLEYPSSSIEQLHDQVESKTGHRLPENTTRLHLCEVLGRFERQALDYNKCTRDELCKFVLQRKLAGKEDVKWTKEQLVEVLETADEDRTFNFMGLSPELRCQVYAL
ncbi:hypothetical protein PRZ48_012609 [Zasmidium cellare]|uniref:Uncharacterized protein n=1 Tax=Zasmidium cellare TaxID=395010 RepID=A0ABR0E5D4_ZASCE|nr:hypothetical protein PRZ48_012609 [Zasmidium cellare]